jgi:hypothetical protein
MTDERIFAKIQNNKEAVEVILQRRSSYIKRGSDEALAKWKDLFESELVDDVDRALIA